MNRQTGNGRLRPGRPEPVRAARAPRQQSARAAQAGRAPRPVIQIVPAVRSLSDRVFQSQSKYFYRLFGVTMLIVAIGLVMVLSSSSIDSLKASGNPFGTFLRQILFAAFGFVGMATLSMLRSETFAKWGGRAYGFTLVLQLLVLTPLGVSVGGNSNWLPTGLGFNIQPSEFMKLALVLALSAFFAQRQAEIDNERRFAYPALLFALAGIGLVFLGKDLGTDIVIGLIVFSMLFLSGAPLAGLTLPAGVAAIAIVAAASTGSRAARISSWLNPGTDDSSPFTWQSLHGIWALAAGRLTGAGLGQSRLKWSWIPEVENDYIFAIIGEEFGLLGAMCILAIFIFMMFTMLSIVQRTSSFFKRMVATGVLAWISIQMVINVAVVLQCLPVLGVPLPLISSGGSSLISAMLAIGVMLAIERENHAEERLGRPAGRPAARVAPVRPRTNRTPSERR